MKRIVVGFLIGAALACVSIGALFAETIERDKALHFGASYTAQVLCASVVSEVIKDKQVTNASCFVAVNALGVAIEHGAFGENTKDIKDIGANVLGSGLGVLTVEWKF